MSNITVENRDTAAIIHLEGRLDSSNSAEFEGAVKDSVSANPKRVVLDMANVAFMSSAALRVILALMKESKAIDAEVFVAAASENVQEIFRISGFQSVIQAVPTLEEALQ